MRVCLWVAIFTGMFMPPAMGASLRGNLFGELYTFRDQDTTHLRPYTGLRADLSLWRTPNGKALDLIGFLRWTSNLRTERPTVPSTNVYDLYLHLSGVPNRVDLYAGRQFAYNAAGSTVVDGLRLRYQVVRSLNLDLFGGSSVDALTPTKVRSLSSFGTYGGRLSWTINEHDRIGLNWLDRLTKGNESWHRAAIDAEHRLDLWQAYGRVSYDLTVTHVAELLGRLSYSPRNWYLCGEYSWREPSVSSTSLFSIIDYRRYQQIRLEARRTVGRDLAIYTQLHGTLYTGEGVWRVAVGVRGLRYDLGWRHQSGRDGDNNSVNGSVNFQLAPRLDFYAGFNAGRYRVQTEQEGHSDAYSSQIGVTWRGVSGYSATLEGQYQRNAVQKSGSQLYLRIAKDFSIGQNGVGGGW